MPFIKKLLHTLIIVVNLSHSSYGISSMMRAYDKRLRLIIGNTANAINTLHIIDILVELSPERCILNIMDSPVEAILAIYCHASSPCSKM